MVAKTYYATKDMRHPIYRTRMLKAGDEVDISGPLGPAFAKMGHLTEDKPRRAPAKVEADAPDAKTPEATKPKASPRKRKAKAKK